MHIKQEIEYAVQDLAYKFLTGTGEPFTLNVYKTRKP